MVRKLIMLALLLSFGVATFGCASTSPKSISDPDTVKHNDKGQIL